MPSPARSSSPDLILDTFDLPELVDVVADTRNHRFLSAAFPDETHSNTRLEFFAYISKNIHQIEQELSRHRAEQRNVYNEMMANSQFRRQIRPIVHFHRQNDSFDRRPTRVRLHPYRRPTPYPSNANSSSSGRSRRSGNTENSVDLQPTSSSSATSYYTLTSQPGSQLNPINVDENSNDNGCRCDEEGGLCDRCDTRIRSCPRCLQEGHAREDCDALIRSFDPATCASCAFFRRSICDHYDVPPAWVKRQKTRLNLSD